VSGNTAGALHISSARYTSTSRLPFMIERFKLLDNLMLARSTAVQFPVIPLFAGTVVRLSSCAFLSFLMLSKKLLAS
jgi:hypothetical protein